MSNRLANCTAACLLIFVFVTAAFSMKDDSLTMDELAHLPAGYSYLTQKDMRLNPEHPPLIKDLAAIPLLFIRGINFPSEIKNWKEDVNGQWGFGWGFFYDSGNPANKMIFWGRIPMIFVLILLGFYVFKWSKELWGNETGLLALFLFSFSPTLLAHARLVTTDVGAAFGVAVATYYFIKALANPAKRNIVFSGIAFGVAELLKFSLILLVPFFIFLTFIWRFVEKEKLRQCLKILVFVFVIGGIVIGLVYQYHVWNYPPERQARDAAFLLSSHPIKQLGPILAKFSLLPVLRAYAWYFTGLFLVLQRAAYGHTTYFLGEISAAGWKNYFPVVYSIKEPLAFHILTIIAVLYAAWLIQKPPWIAPVARIKEWLKYHFAEFAMLCFVGIYWATSLTSSLNIGVRHLLPVFPFTILLVSRMLIKFLQPPFLKIKCIIFGILIVWQVVSLISIFPHFLAYFNELAGGPDSGYLYTVDSNLDWGQDLKRLKKWTDENNIDKIYVDYFGGGDADYYLKEKYAPWWGARNPEELPKGSYLAVSASFLQGGRGEPAPGFDQPFGYYHWLDHYEPIAKIGYSIFVYYIK